MSKNNQLIIKIAIVVSLLASGFFIYKSIFTLNDSTEAVTNPAHYKEILSKFSPSEENIKHFPKEIPADAKNTRLFYTPGLLQGAMIFQLRMNLPPDKIKSIEAEFLNSAKRKYIPGGKNNSPVQETSPKGVGIRYEYKFHRDEDKEEDFPENYEILVLEDTRGAPKYDWNHSNLYGVAIDVANSEIVYWAEKW